MTKNLWDRFDKLLTEKRIAICCTVLFALSLLPVLIIAFYDHPCSDDYSYGLYAAQTVREGGSLWQVLAAAARETKETYFDWQGTFSAVFLMALQPAAFGEEFYAITPYIMLASLLFGTFFFCRELLVHRLSMSNWAWVTTSCALGFFMVHFAPDPFEGFFWYNGALFYTFFHGVMLCMLALLSKFLRTTAKGRSFACALGTAVLAFFLGGGNYPTALLSCVLLFAAVLFAFCKPLDLPHKLGTLLFLLLELAAFGISILAPGNSVRQAHFENRPGAIKAIVLALGASVRNITEWTTLPFLLALLFLCPLFCKYAAKLSFRFPLPFGAVCVAVCLLGVLLTPPIYAMGGTGAGRMEDLYYYAFCLLAAGVTFYLCGWFTHRPGLWKAVKTAKLAASPLLAGLVVTFGLSVACLSNFTSLTGVSAALSLWRGEAQGYDAQVQAQAQLLEDPSSTDVVVESITYRPELLLPTSVPVLSEDPENPVNQRVATFYGKNSVVAREK